MESNKNNSILVASLICIGVAILSFFMKWLNIYVVHYSLWEAADTLRQLSRYAGSSEYQIMIWFLYIGTVSSMGTLALDGYRVAKPLLNGKSDLQSAQNAGIGMIISAIFTVTFMLVLLSMSEGDLNGATFTFWPYVNISLCIVGKILLRRIQFDKTSPSDPGNNKEKPQNAPAPFSESAVTPPSEPANKFNINITEYDELMERLAYVQTAEDLVILLDSGVKSGKVALINLKKKYDVLKNHLPTKQIVKELQKELKAYPQREKPLGVSDDDATGKHMKSEEGDSSFYGVTAYSICSNGHKFEDLDLLYCPECGLPVKKVVPHLENWVCSCGNTNKPKYNFCIKCGNPRTSTEVRREETRETQGTDDMFAPSVWDIRKKR